MDVIDYEGVNGFVIGFSHGKKLEMSVISVIYDDSSDFVYVSNKNKSKNKSKKSANNEAIEANSKGAFSLG